MNDSNHIMKAIDKHDENEEVVGTKKTESNIITESQNVMIKLQKCDVKSCKIRNEMGTNNFTIKDVERNRNSIKICRKDSEKSRNLLKFHLINYDITRQRQKYCVRNEKMQAIGSCLLCLGLVLKMGKKTINRLLVLNNISSKIDMRGKHVNHANRFGKISSSYEESVIKWLGTLKHHKSHYDPKDDRDYLFNIHTQKQLFEKYQSEFGDSLNRDLDQGKRFWFDKIIRKKFPNLRVDDKKTDVCNDCISFELRISQESSIAKKKQILEEKFVHLQNVRISRDYYQKKTKVNKKRDFGLSSIIDEKEKKSMFTCWDIDYLSNVGLPIHKKQESSLHYASKLNCKLLMVCQPGISSKKTSIVHLWDEYSGKKGVNESLTVLDKQMKQDESDFIFIQTDKAGGQLHNGTTYHYQISKVLLKEKVCIISDHLESGHSYFDPDQRGKLVKDCIKRSGNIDSVEQLFDAINKSQTLSCRLLKKDDHLDFKTYLNNSKCFADFEGIQSINQIRIDAGVFEGKIFFKEVCGINSEWKTHYFLRKNKTIKELISYLKKEQPQKCYANEHLRPTQSKFNSYQTFVNIVSPEYRHLYLDPSNPSTKEIVDSWEKQKQITKNEEDETLKVLRKRKRDEIKQKEEELRSTNAFLETLNDVKSSQQNFFKKLEECDCVQCGYNLMDSFISKPRSKIDKSDIAIKKRQRKEPTCSECGKPVKGHARQGRKLHHPPNQIEGEPPTKRIKY